MVLVSDRGSSRRSLDRAPELLRLGRYSRGSAGTSEYRMMV
jgi:hypothetical protein